MRRAIALLTTAVVAIAAVAVLTNGDEPDFFPVGPVGDGPAAAGGMLEAYDSCDALTDDLVSRATAQGIQLYATDDSGGTAVEEMAADVAAPSAGLAATGEGASRATAGGTSDTNVAVAGIDEPDLVETDGRRLFSVVSGRLVVVDVLADTPVQLASVSLGDDGWHQLLLVGDRLLAVGQVWGEMLVDDAVGAPDMRGFAPMASTTRMTLFDVSTDTPRELATTDVEGNLVAARGVGGVVHVVSQHWPQAIPWQTMDDAMRQPDAEAAVKQAYEAAPAEAWLPRTVVTDAATGTSVTRTMACEAVSRVPGTVDQGLLTITTFDVGRGDLTPTGSSAIVSDGQSVTATADRLVVATSVYPQGPIGVPVPMPMDDVVILEDVPAATAEAAPAEEVTPEAPPTLLPTTEPAPGPTVTDTPTEPPTPTIEPTVTEPTVEPTVVPPTTEPTIEPTTEPTVVPSTEPTVEPTTEPAPTEAPVEVTGPRTLLHLFSIDASGATHLASGSVAGSLLNQFAMSIRDGRVRVATTVEDWNAGTSVSQLAVLEQAGSELVEVGRVGDLGPTEVIHAVRFMGDTAYVVTFRQTDPLYTIDLRDPTAPRVVGELKIPGYSAYLHPLPDGRLLGIGQDATEDGRTTGLQVSVFDVSDPASPLRTAQLAMEGASSTAEFDHLAVTYHEGRLFLPYTVWGQPIEVDEDGDGVVEDHRQEFDAGVLVVDVEGDALREVGRMQLQSDDPYGGEVARVVVVEGNAVLVSHHQVAVFDRALSLRGTVTTQP